MACPMPNHNARAAQGGGQWYVGPVTWGAGRTGGITLSAMGTFLGRESAGPRRQFKLRLAASSQTCFRTNVPDDPPVPKLHRVANFRDCSAQWNSELPLSKFCSAVAMMSRLS